MTNRKQTRRALLSSAAALLLCFAMLLGTTFAWFTDTASTRVNTIQAGTLDVELLDEEENPLEGETLAWQKAEGHGEEAVLWEPGCTYSLQPVTIRNNGNLALKYKIAINGIDGDAKLNEVIDWSIEVDGANYSAETEFHLGAGDSDELTISGTMQDTADNTYQGLSIESVSIIVYATQDTVEYDSYDNLYDEDAEYDTISGSPVNTLDELNEALTNGETEIAVMHDIEVSAPIEITGNVTLNGLGSISLAEGYTGTMFQVAEGATLTLRNIEINGSNEWSWKEGQKDSTSMPSTGGEYDITKAVDSNGTELTASLIASSGKLVLGKGCVITDAYYIGAWGANPIVRTTGGTLTIDGAVIKNNLGTIFSVDSTNVTINNCTIKDNFAYNANKGGIFALFNSTCTMNGGTITDNAGHVRSGFIFGVVNGSKLTINGGTISNNKVKNRGSSTGSVVCCESGGDFDMNGGSITNNRGVLAGALSARWVFNGDTSNTIINLNGGTISGNTCIQHTWHDPEVFIRDTMTTIGAGMTINGNVVLDSGTSNLTNNGTIDGDVFVQNASATMTNNGTVTGDVTVTAGTFTGSGTVNGTITNP